jgi:hypothetical protein
MLESAPTSRSGSDVLVLMDTSASQVGLYRQDSLAALEALLSGLSDQDRVRLVAVDVNAVSAARLLVGSPWLGSPRGFGEAASSHAARIHRSSQGIAVGDQVV